MIPFNGYLLAGSAQTTASEERSEDEYDVYKVRGQCRSTVAGTVGEDGAGSSR